MFKILKEQKAGSFTYIEYAMLKGVAAALFTLLLYQFYYIEFIRSSVEDSAFDTVNWFPLSKLQTETNSSNVFLLMVDDKYLRSKELLDENNETNYGYLFPRDYLSEIITTVDELVSQMDEKNSPRALFLDYDLSYLSDPHNKIMSKGDVALLDTLKKSRDYTIYLPMTSNYNYIYYSKDKKIKELIKESKIKFVSTGLTNNSDGVSRRYYPYEIYIDKNKGKKQFVNIAVELYEDKPDFNISNIYSQEGISIIENRIIFKDKSIIEDNKYTFWQSNWKNLSAMSANYPLDMIYENEFKNSIFMIGATHGASQDNFEVDGYGKTISGLEMHANALMTLYYLDGKLKRLPLYLSVIIVFIVVSSIDFMLSFMYGSKGYKKIHGAIAGIKFQWFKEILYRFPTSLWANFFSFLLTLLSKVLQFVLYRFIPSSRDSFFSVWLTLLSIAVLFVVSVILLLLQEHYWFNWMIPSMLSIPYILIFGLRKIIKR